MAIHPKIVESLADFDREEIPCTLPRELPLLERLRETFPDRKAFIHVDVLFIQHQLGPFIPRLNAMVSDGLNKARCWFVDIPYSTNELVREALLKNGFNRNQMPLQFADPLEDYDESQSMRIFCLMQRLAKREKPRRLLVIDDGAYFVRFLKNAMLHSPELLPAFTGSCIVEQTTRGHRYLKQYLYAVVDACKLSVVSIARCHTKLDFESPFIGAAVSRALVRTHGEDRLADLRNIAVIGFGAVGKATVSRLAERTRRATIDVVDVDAQARQAVSRVKSPWKTRCRGLKELPRNMRYELVVGCTGYNSFRLDQRILLADGGILASGSSAAVEFNRAGFIELADRRPDDEIKILGRNKTRKSGIHATIKFAQENGKIFSFLNAGFPVNFDGRVECIPSRVIQATHCLLYSAAKQVLKQSQPGLNKISPVLDSWIFNNALKEL